MIKQILDRDFMLRHLHEFGAHLDNERQLLESGDAGARDRARRSGINAQDLRDAQAALAEAQGDPHAREIRDGQQVFLPPHPAASALQTAMQQQLIDRQPALIDLPATL